MLIGVNYTLHGVKDYDRLHKLLKSTGTYCRVLDSFWIVKSSESVDVWYTRLRAVMDSDDHILVHDMTEAFANNKVRGWLPKYVVEWVNSFVGVPTFSL